MPHLDDDQFEQEEARKRALENLSKQAAPTPFPEQTMQPNAQPLLDILKRKREQELLKDLFPSK